MALTRWDPFTTLSRLDEDFDQLVRRAWGAPTGSRGGSTTAGFVPAIEMRTEGSDVVITLELPGVDVENDVDIEAAPGRLTITGERRDQVDQPEEGAGRVLVRELRYGSFRREFALPEGINAGDVEATYDRGMLQVRVRNVTKPAVPPQKVSIRSADQQRTIEGHAESSGS
jgi:HSP20 family protein